MALRSPDSSDFMDRLRALPGVQMVGMVENVPLNESTGIVSVRNEQMGDDPRAAAPKINRTWAAGDYFKTMGIKLLEGEVFASRDLPRQWEKSSSAVRPRSFFTPARAQSAAKCGRKDKTCPG